MNWSRNLNVDRPAGRIGRVAQVFFGSLVCVLLAACAPPAGQGSPSQSESSSTLSPVVSPATPTPTVPQTSEPTGPSSVLVYFVTETPTGPRLAGGVGAYIKAVRPEVLGARIVAPRFEDTDARGTRKIVSFYAKRARGTMAGWLVRNRVRTASALTGFDADGYRHDKAASTPDVPVFVRSFEDRPVPAGA